MHRFAILSVFLVSLWSGCLFAQTGGNPKAAERHIALLLPLQSDAFGRAAEAFRQGFITAAAFQAGPPIIAYPSGDQTAEILKAYRLAVQAGAALVVGPLTRNAVTALLEEPLPLPTLALNTPEHHDVLPKNLYLFSLNIESEARQIARLAYADGHRSAVTVTANTPLAKRVQGAFTDEWLKLGGILNEHLSFTASPASYLKLRAAFAKVDADMLFLAAGADKARAVRPYLDRTLPTYATSQIYDNSGGGGRNLDLNQIRFIEMPWFLLADHPAVLVYPRPANPMSVEQERFYVLGIDAFRIAALLLDPPPSNEAWMIDGVTGRIILNAQQFNRELTAAQFRQGEAAALP